IAYLTDDIRRLSAELRKKEAILSSFSEKLREKELLLSSFTDLATDQSKQISTLSAALQDTVLWDPSGIRAPVSSTPGPQPWTEVIVRDRRRRHTRAVIPALPLGNRYEALAAVEASITPPAKSDEQQDLPRASPAQSSPPATSHWTLASVPAIGAPPVDSSLGAEVISNGCPRVPPVKHPSVAASTIQSDQANSKMDISHPGEDCCRRQSPGDRHLFPRCLLRLSPIVPLLSSPRWNSRCREPLEPLPPHTVSPAPRFQSFSHCSHHPL
ncbi:unnamed protein product, partial [Gadus morhua 'NCC']